jgi:signal transduction histidine kinase
MTTRIHSTERLHEMSETLEVNNRSLSRALLAAEQMASRAMSLQEVTAALSQAHTEEEVAAVVLGKGLGVIGSDWGVLARVDNGRFELIRATGYAPEAAEGVLEATLDNDSPLTCAVKTGQPLWLESPDEHRTRFPVVYQQLGIPAPQASVAVPLRHGEQTVGALAMYFVDSATFCVAKQAFALLLAQAAAGALFRARNYTAERDARRGAETLAQARADVLGIVAHDLRNPLSLIISTSEMLLETDQLPQDRRAKMLVIMQRSAQRMNRLIGDLLDATQIQAGRLSLDLADVDARRIVREAEETFGASARAQNIELRSETPEHPCWVHADEGRLVQAVGNLVANAIKFTAAGGHVTLSVRQHGAEAVFSVSDSGPGIPEEHQHRLFDTFWQARTGDRRGVGLGLSITKDIVGALGGRIWVESSVGVGTCFSIALPSSADPPAVFPRAAEARYPLARDRARAARL